MSSLFPRRRWMGASQSASSSPSMAGVAVRGLPTSVARLPLRRAGGASLRQAQRTVAMAANGVQEKIKSTTASSPVVVFSKTYCPCVKRKRANFS